MKPMKPNPPRGVHTPGARADATQRLNVSLLVSLQALLSTQSVSGAAAKLSVVQPAMSRHLALLRELTGDQLLVRSGSRMILTPRAESLKLTVGRVLADLSLIYDGDAEFAPAAASRKFRLATYDFLPTRFFAQLVQRVTTQSPQSSLEIQTIGDRADFVRRLSEGDIDVAITSRMDIPGVLRAVHLLTEPLACIVRQGHPLLREPTLACYTAADHVSSLEQAPGAGAAIDALLAEAGIALRTTVRTQYLSLIPAMLAQTDLVFTTGRTLAKTMASQWDLQTLAVPAPVRPVSCFLVWHERTHHDRAAAWLREQITVSAGALRVADLAP